MSSSALFRCAVCRNRCQHQPKYIILKFVLDFYQPVLGVAGLSIRFTFYSGVPQLYSDKHHSHSLSTPIVRPQCARVPPLKPKPGPLLSVPSPSWHSFQDEALDLNGKSKPMSADYSIYRSRRLPNLLSRRPSPLISHSQITRTVQPFPLRAF